MSENRPPLKPSFEDEFGGTKEGAYFETGQATARMIGITPINDSTSEAQAPPANRQHSKNLPVVDGPPGSAVLEAYTNQGIYIAPYSKPPEQD